MVSPPHPPHCSQYKEATIFSPFPTRFEYAASGVFLLTAKRLYDHIMLLPHGLRAKKEWCRHAEWVE